MQRSKVDLPEPLEPIIAITSPVLADSETPFSTSASPKRLCKSSTLSVVSIELNSFTQIEERRDAG